MYSMIIDCMQLVYFQEDVYSVWLLHHCSPSVSDSWSDMVSMFVQVLGSASHVHNSVHCTLCSRHEQRLLHELLTHPHFTSCKTDCGAGGTLVRTGMSSPFASRDHPRVVGSSIGLLATSTCCHT